MNLLTLSGNPFAQSTKNFYVDWWNRNKDKFINCPNPFPFEKVIKNQDTIPYLEITPLHKVAKNGILFINCNPAGTDSKYYKKHNQNKEICFYYNNDAKKTYARLCESFAADINVSEYAMIDIFPIVVKEQKVIKEDFNNPNNGRSEAYDELLDFFLKMIVEIQPKVIAVTNGFIKNLFIDKNSSLNKKFDKFVEDSEKCCYYIKIGDFETTLFCSGMIKGQHALDSESLKRFKRDIRCYFNHTTINF